MRLQLIILTIILYSCKSYTPEDIEGKWYAYTNNQYQDAESYMELWVSDSLALSYQAAVDEFQTYKFSLKDNKMTFQLIDSHMMDEHEFTLNVESLKNGELYTKFIGSALSDPNLTYYLIDKKMPKFYPEVDINEHLLDEIHMRLERENN